MYVYKYTYMYIYIIHIYIYMYVPLHVYVGPSYWSACGGRIESFGAVPRAGSAPRASRSAAAFQRAGLGKVALLISASWSYICTCVYVLCTHIYIYIYNMIYDIWYMICEISYISTSVYMCIYSYMSFSIPSSVALFELTNTLLVHTHEPPSGTQCN